jgi:3-oxoacyl-(acyl-carrier-protein) synthase
MASVTAMAAKDPSQRIVITGMGICSVFGNNVDTFYDKLLAGESGIDMIDRFDTTEFPTKFAGQIKNFDSEGLIDRKNERRYDDCLKYTLVRVSACSLENLSCSLLLRKPKQVDTLLAIFMCSMKRRYAFGDTDVLNGAPIRFGRYGYA